MADEHDLERHGRRPRKAATRNEDETYDGRAVGYTVTVGSGN